MIISTQAIQYDNIAYLLVLITYTFKRSLSLYLLMYK